MKKESILIITACGYFPSKNSVRIENVHVGLQGVITSFIEKGTLPEVYEDSSFQILFQLDNKGIADVRNGFYSIGVEDQLVQIPEGKIGRFNLNGKSVFSPFGEVRQRAVRAKTLSLPPQVRQISSVLRINTCYQYMTEATAIVCIDSDIENQQKKKVCSSRDIGLSGGQGSPVAVTSVASQFSPHDDSARVNAEFFIKIQNSGDGQVVGLQDFSNACVGKSALLNEISVRASLAGIELSCDKSLLKLQGGVAEAVCSVPDSIERSLGVFTSPLLVEIEYGYWSSVAKNIVIKKK